MQLNHNVICGQHNHYIKICDIYDLTPDAKFPIYGVSDPEDPISNTVIFVKKTFNESVSVKNCIIVSKNGVAVDESIVQIVTQTPKNAYADILHKILQQSVIEENVLDNNGSFISKEAQIAHDTKIGKFCVIESDVIIGSNCSIGNYTHIGSHVRIGDNVVIKERCSIGISDADIYRDTEDNCLTLPHLAGVIIEDGCLFLNDAHVAAGDTRATVINRGSMVGIDANIGHNSHVGKNTLIGAYACVCGHCDVGDNVYIAPSSTIMNRLHVGSNSKVGLGAIVLSDVKDNESVFGNPAMAYWKTKD